MSEPGPVLARGRSADVYDLGAGRVLRRLRRGVVGRHELEAMRHVRAHGYPVPVVFDAAGPDLVMERLDGRDLLSELARRPWRCRRIGRLLADLHRRLASIPVTGLDMRVVIEPGEALYHSDLHPGNVIATPAGPRVIDWEGCGLAPADADVATTWLLLASAQPDELPVVVRPLVGLVRRQLTAAFLGGVERPRRSTVAAVCRLRLADPNMREAERRLIAEFGLRYGDAQPASEA